MRRPRAARISAAIVLLASAIATAAPLPWTSAARWSAMSSPAAGTPRAIGTYTAGCVRGAEPMPPEGPGFEVVRLARGRFFGHPALIDYLRDLGAAVHERKLPALLIGDLSQARGGPLPSDHGSHQSGLDVDVAFVRPKPEKLSIAEREAYRFTPIVDAATNRKTDEWSEDVHSLLAIAAADRRVERIFVNAAVKRELCRAPGDKSWLAKVRPWWGHDDHFHVRLGCPADSPHCRPQPPAATGSGCGAELAWWLGPEPAKARAERRRTAVKAPPLRLPGECKLLVR